jgi:hypothetical protein
LGLTSLEGSDLILLDEGTSGEVYTYIELTGIASKTILLYVLKRLGSGDGRLRDLRSGHGVPCPYPQRE